jgi:hypothetical protein
LIQFLFDKYQSLTPWAADARRATALQFSTTPLPQILPACVPRNHRFPPGRSKATVASGLRIPGFDNRRAGRNIMRRLLLIIGLLALAVGLLWIGQGTGLIAWPETSFMINQLQWAGYGALLAALGLILIWQATTR